MSQHPMMRLQTPDARARKQAIREQLIDRVEDLHTQNEELDKEIEELGLGSFLKKVVKKVEKVATKVLGKDDKPKSEESLPAVKQRGGSKSDFKETLHPRGKDGKFAKAPAASSPNVKTKGGGLLNLKSHVENAQDPPKERDIQETKPKKPGDKINGISVHGSVYSTVLKNGKKLSIYDDDKNSLPVETKQEMLRQLADLHEMYPKKFKTTNVLLKDIKGTRNLLGPGTEGVGGWVRAHLLPTVGSLDRINVNADNPFFDPNNVSEPGHHMDQAYKKSYGRYVIAHEFGHQFDIAKNRMWLKKTAYNPLATNSLYTNPNVNFHLSAYGRKSPQEAYAETFAEWHLSKGKTTNPAAIAYARHEKWASADSLRSSAFDESMVEFAGGEEEVLEDSIVSLQPGEFIIVDDMVKGGYIIGELPEAPEPTAEEKKYADDIICEVYEELGLPYKE